VGKGEKSWAVRIVKNKKPDSVESGLAVAFCGFFQPWRWSSAPVHRRQADPCQRAHLAAVILTEAAAATTRVEKFIAGRDEC
jgi:hypothetical protein